MSQTPTRRIGALLALSLLPALPVLSQSAAPDPDEPAPAAPGKPALPPIPPVLGELTRLDNGRFEVKPWDPKLPRRLRGALSPEARIFRVREGKQSDLRPGDIALVVERIEKETRSQARKQSSSILQPEPTGAAGDSTTVVRAMTVVRFWKPAGDAITPAEQGLARRVLLATSGFLPHAASRYGGDSRRDRTALGDPYFHKKTFVGVVRSADPLVIALPEGEQAFHLGSDTVYVNADTMERGELKKGQTVLIRSRTPPSTEIDLEPRIVVRCPPPKLSIGQTRRLILREQHKDENTPAF